MFDADSEQDYLADLRREVAHQKRMEAHHSRHPHPFDPSYIGPDDYQEEEEESEE